MTSYYDKKDNAKKYIQMAAGYDGRELIETLTQYLPQGSSVLELGMGPGVDLDLLSQHYQATGSDNAQTFLDLYKEKNTTADLLLLDARTLETERKFDGIYSNKVLIHLAEDELRESFQRQKAILNTGGILLHSFWLGDKEEFFEGQRFRYYTEEMLLAMVAPQCAVLEMKRYGEFEEGDSFYIVLQSNEFSSMNSYGSDPP